MSHTAKPATLRPTLRRDLIMARIAQSPAGTLVLVSAEYAALFKPVPQDGRRYIVQDPVRPSLHHDVSADGSHTILDPHRYAVPVHIRHHDGTPVKKPPRYASRLTVSCAPPLAPDTPPPLRLITLARVTEIIGFKKSFVYEQPDFPEPIRLGSSRRAAVRWVEAEVIAWAAKLMARRSTAAQQAATAQEDA